MKVSIVVDPTLSLGLIANTVAVLSVALGASQSELIGPDTKDRSGVVHRGITRVPLPVLSASREQLSNLVHTAQLDPDLIVIGFNHVAQNCTTYDDYLEKLESTSFESLHFLGVLLLGPQRSVARLTGSLPLLK